MNKDYNSNIFITLVVIFIAALISANVLAVKIISIFGFFLPAGIIVFPITYILGDVLTEVYGYKKAKKVIWLGFLANLVFVIFVLIAIYLPSAPIWKNQDSFKLILGLTPRLLLASFSAFLVGSFSNALIMSKMKVATKSKFLWSRVIGSTIVGEGLDSLVFIIIAFYGIFPTNVLFNLFITQWSFKVIYETIMVPITYKAISYLKEKEKSDVVDLKISYNPFNLR